MDYRYTPHYPPASATAYHYRYALRRLHRIICSDPVEHEIYSAYVAELAGDELGAEFATISAMIPDPEIMA